MYEDLFELPEEREVKPDVAARTGVMSLDLVLGGGLPSGLVEIYGEESVGKTAVVGHIIHAAQAGGMETMLCSSEKYDGAYMRRLGVREDELVLVRGMLEPVREIVAHFLDDAIMNRLVVIDSLTAFRPQEEELDTWNKEVYETLQLLKDIIRVGSTVVCVSQVRAVWSGDKASSRTESSVRWVHELFDTRLELSRQNVEEDAFQMIVNVMKSARGRPSVWVELPVRKGFGIDLWRDYVRVAKRFEVLEQRGGRYYFHGQSIAQGEDGMVEVLKENNLLFGEVLHSIFAAAGWS